METNSILDIKVTGSPLERHFSVQPATIYIEGLPKSFDAIISAMNRRFGQDAGARGPLSVYRVVSVGANGGDGRNLRITAMVENPFTMKRFWLEADADVVELTQAVGGVVAEADRLMRDFYTDRMVDAVFDNPDGFLDVVSKMFSRPGSIIRNVIDKGFSRMVKWGAASILPSVGYAAFNVMLSTDEDDRDDDLNDATEPCSAPCEAPSPCPMPAQDQESRVNRSARRKKAAASKNLSARERQDLILDIPKNISKGYLKKNSESHEMIKELFSTFTPEEFFEVVSRMNLLSKVASGLIDNSCDYDIVVRPVRKGDPVRFRGKLGYNLYLRDPKGREHAVEFKYTAAHCMYMLHVLNRKQHGGDTIDLDLPKFEKEFRRLYEFLFGSDPQTADHNFRSTSKDSYEDIDGKKKNGRFKEYIQDIHTGLCKIAGDGDSMPLKIAEGRPLALAPSQIHISEDFNIFKINYA